MQHTWPSRKRIGASGFGKAFIFQSAFTVAPAEVVEVAGCSPFDDT